ncbi:MAG TPA: hypothetical protein VIV11_27860 [Kofleriaceae bacterium]
MIKQERAFERSQTDRRIMLVLGTIGLVASLLLAFPLMIGLEYALVEGSTFLFPIPFVACYVLAKLIIYARNR